MTNLILSIKLNNYIMRLLKCLIMINFILHIVNSIIRYGYTELLFLMQSA